MTNNLPAQPDSSTNSSSVAAIISLISKWAVDHELGEPKDMDQTFADAGFDSLHSVELAFFLEDQLGVQVDDTVLWTCPTFASLAQYLAERSNTRDTTTVNDGNATKQPIADAAEW